MNNRLLAFAGLAVVGALVSVGSADTVINAYVQQFGATPHTVFETPNGIHNVQIDWLFSEDYNFIDACLLIFDREVPAGSIVTCKVSGHDEDPTDGELNPGPIIGWASVTVDPASRTVDVPILCDPDGDGTFDRCDVQDIEDVKVIVVGKETDVVVAEGPEVLCEDGIDNDGDGLIDLDDPDCAV